MNSPVFWKKKERNDPFRRIPPRPIMIWTFLATLSACLWIAILLLPWRPFSTRERIDSLGGGSGPDLAGITVLIPARNEAAVIERALSALQNQGRNLALVLVDDRSRDRTAELTRRAWKGDLRLVSGEDPPAGWSGKLWAMEQGYPCVKTSLTLLLDADIALAPGILEIMQRKMKEESLPFLSLMAEMRMISLWERLFMPAFVYFFKMLYPFGLSNSRSYRTAAAAGGCILLETKLIAEMGGFKRICSTLIDDCALAREVKARGHKTWIGLTRSVSSLRSYDTLGGIWQMVARTAFFQLHYSIVWLLGASLAMLIAFGLPVAGLFFPGGPSKTASAIALAAMILTYLPTLKFYARPGVWSVTLPFVALFYLCMTWSSAIRFWSGSGSIWKERAYAGTGS
jgi:hopene-associated glycosyltransferase HpnB